MGRGRAAWGRAACAAWGRAAWGGYSVFDTCPFYFFFITFIRLRTYAIKIFTPASSYKFFVSFVFTSYAKNDSFLSFDFRIYFCLATRSEHNEVVRCAPNASVFFFIKKLFFNKEKRHARVACVLTSLTS